MGINYKLQSEKDIMNLDNPRQRGFFAVFEGIDGSGEDTQLDWLYRRTKKFNKYQDILATHEPWRNEEIQRRLREDQDAYKDPELMADLFIGDRIAHSLILIRQNILAGVDVFDTRYAMSTDAFQWAQGVSLEVLLRKQNVEGILTPDVTYILKVSRETAKERMRKRGDPPEKFERNPEFIDRVIENYDKLAAMGQEDSKLFGKVFVIDGEKSIEEVSDAIWADFLPRYKEFKGYDFKWRSLSRFQRANTTIDSTYQKGQKEDLQ